MLMEHDFLSFVAFWGTLEHFHIQLLWVFLQTGVQTSLEPENWRVIYLSMKPENYKVLNFSFSI